MQAPTTQSNISYRAKSPLSKLLRRLSYSIASLIIMLAVILSLARALAPLLSNYQPQLQSLVTRLIHQPVTFKEVKVTWYWLEPVLEFSKVNVLNREDQHSIVKINKLDIGIDVIESLLTRRLATGILIASGSRLTVQQDAKGEVSIIGVEDLAAGLNNTKQQSPRYVLEWLFSQDKIALRDINLQWISADGTIVPVQNFSLSLVNDGDQHQLRGHGKLAQMISSRITLMSSFEGNAENIQNWHGQLYVKASDVLLSQWLKDQAFGGFIADTGQINAQCWLKWKDLQLTSFDTLFDVNNLNLIFANTKESQLFQTIRGHLTFNRDNKDWQLQMDDLIVRSEGQTWPTNQWLLTKTRDEKEQINYRFYVHYLQLQTVIPLLLKNINFPSELIKPVLTLKPQGELFETVLEHTVGLDEWQVKSQFKQIAINPWQHVPGLKGFSGRLELNTHHGLLQVDSSSLSIGDHNLFRNTLFFDHWKGDYEWQHDEEGWWLTAKNNEIKNNDISINTEFTWHNNSPSSSGELYLLGGFSFSNTQNIANYLPAKLPSENFDPDLVTWLEQAFDGGGSGVGTMIFRGDIDQFPFRNKQGVFLVESNINNINLHYWKHWPWAKQLFGELDFRNEAMNATIFSGMLDNVSLNNISAEIPDLGSPSKVLALQGDITSTAEDVVQYISESPVKESVHQLKQLELSGPVYLALELLLPLKHLERDFSLTIEGLLQNSSLVLPWNHVVTGLKGALHITREGVSSENLEAMLFSSPAKLSLKPSIKNNHAVATEISVESIFPTISILNTNVEISQICVNSHNNFFMSNMARQLICENKTMTGINGSSNYQAIITIPKNNDDPITISLRSDLMGINSGLPQPFDKIADQSLPLIIKATLQNNRLLQIAAQLEKRASAILQFELTQQKWQLRQGNLLLGEGDASLPKQKRFLINGEIKQFDSAIWWPYLKKIWNASSVSLSTSPSWFDLSLNNVLLYGLTFPTLSVQANPNNDSWFLHFSGPVIEGDLMLPLRKDKTIKANFQRLIISAKTNNFDRFKLKPDDVPSMKVRINQFQYNNIPLGRLLLNLTQQNQILKIDEFSLTNGINKLQTNGQWIEEKGKDNTYLQGSFETSSLAKTLNMLGYSPFIAAKSTKSQFNLFWQGSPYDFSLKRLNGIALVKMNDGNITHLDSDTELKIGMGRLINLLSLQSLPRRLMLDFTDLTKEGFHFNKLQSQWQLKQGNAKLGATYIEGSVASIDMSGDINLVREQYDILLNVSPQVTASLPVIVAAAAASPIAGAVTFVASKIVSQIMKKTLYYTYTVTGPWKNPVVKEIEETKS